MTPMHVLVVDDESDIREVTALSLQVTAGWRVSTARGGDEGIAMACAEPPDAILLDVMMPELDGPATLRCLRADPRTRHVPVIFLTAKTQSSVDRGIAMLDVAGTLNKPFDPMTLANQICAVLTGSDETP